MPPRLLALLTAVCLGTLAGGLAEGKERVLADKALAAQVRASVQRGATRLKSMRTRDGSWSYDGSPTGSPDRPGGRRRPDLHASAGLTALALYALSSAGVHAGDDAVRAGLAWVAKHPALYAPEARYATYAASFLLLALARISPEAHAARIAELADQLAASQLESGQWAYGASAKGIESLGDRSNTQLAVLALWTAREVAGHKVPKTVWTRVKSQFASTQLVKGGWGYRASATRRGGGAATKAKPAMTAAGLCSYVLASAALGGGRKALARARKDKIALKGLAALAPAPLDGIDPYLMWLQERASVLMDRPLADWYVPGARALHKRQRKDGSWAQTPAAGVPAYGDRRGAYETGLALLFLTRASRTATTGR